MIIAYIALATMLLAFNLYSHWHWVVKTTANLVMLFFFWVSYQSWPGMLGWPADVDLPSQFYLQAVIIAEPNYIYLWGTPLQDGMGQSAPRAYSVAYSTALHNKVDKASRKLRKGLPVIGQTITNPTTSTTLDTLDQIANIEQQIEFVDAPQNLVPGKN